MATGEYQQEVSGDDFGDVAEETEVVVVSEGKRSGLSIFALLLGVLILVLDVYLVVQLARYIFAPTLQSGITQALVFVSIIIGVFLLVYAFRYGSVEAADGHRRQTSRFTSAVVLPLLLAAVAVGAIVGGLEMNRAATERQMNTSCVEYIERAQNIAKDNPRFKMPAGDVTELRCNINAAIGR